MENASKALLMAAGVLLGVLLLTLMATIIYFFTNYQAEIESNESAKEIHQFNSQFEVYEEKENLTAQDVLSIYNLVQNYNSKFENEQPIKVTIDGRYVDINSAEYLKEDLNASNGKKYSMEIEYSEKIGKINKIILKTK